MSEPALPETTHLRLALEAGVLYATLDRPDARNALNAALVDDLVRLFDALAQRGNIRVVVLRGAGGHFCAGGDLKEFAASVRASRDDLAATSRRFGALLHAVNAAPQAVVAVLEGTVLGGGVGLACVSDVAIASADVRLGLPEVTRGLAPAQIAPYVVERIGLTEARRLAICGALIDGAEAVRLGFAHRLADDAAGCEQALADVLAAIARCAPGAVAATKTLMREVGQRVDDATLERVAAVFADCLTGAEAREGIAAFSEKRAPDWAETVKNSS